MQVTQRFAQLLTKNVGKVIVGKEKAVELKLIDGYCIGDLSAQQMRAWLDETKEVMKAAARPLQL